MLSIGELQRVVGSLGNYDFGCIGQRVEIPLVLLYLTVLDLSFRKWSGNLEKEKDKKVETVRCGRWVTLIASLKIIR